MPPPDQGHEDARHFVYDDPDFDRDSPMTGWEAPGELSADELRHVQAHYAGEVTIALDS